MPHPVSSLTLAALIAVAAQDRGPDRPTPVADRGVSLCTDAAQPGFTLFQPLNNTTTYLVDNAGEVVHRWSGDYAPGQSTYLLDDGSLLRACKDGDETYRAGGVGGRIQRLAPDGAVVWDYDLGSELRCQHHDIEPLPNGNVLALCWEARSREEALAHGRDPEALGEALWSEVILELRPRGADGAEVVWRWDLFDHLVQDRLEEGPDFGAIDEHPGRVDINALLDRSGPTDATLARLEALGYGGRAEPDEDEQAARDARREANQADWVHLNAIDLHPDGDRLVLSSRTLGEVWVLPYGLSTEQAAGPAGDLIARFGNPAAWKASGADARRLFAPHDARWIESGDGESHVLVYNNGEGRPGGERSSVEEYRLTEWGAELVWSYGLEDDHEVFFSPVVSGATRLTNGNTLICAGVTGRVIEVDPAGKAVWMFQNPFADDLQGGPDGGRRPGAPAGLEDRPGRPRAGQGKPPGGRGGRPDGRHGPGLMQEGALVRAERYSAEHPGVAALRGRQ
ncbi:MAG: aryl-sulfate sulfotransferase [Planctomycetota bacterium]